ncbi:MAG: DUF1405 domain-containing protein [Candidatus Diapherotrites archaeon]
MNRNFFWVIVIGNLIGFIYGVFFYYWQQLMNTNLFLWVFVPDCPLAALLFAVTLIGIKFKKNFQWFYFFSFAFALKYAFWTVFVLLKYNWFYFTPEASFLYSVLFVSHILLFAEQFILLNKIEAKKIFLIITLILFLVFDFSDYVLSTNPPMPYLALSFMFPATIAMTLFFSFFSFWILRKRPKPLIQVF